MNTPRPFPLSPLPLRALALAALFAGALSAPAPALLPLPALQRPVASAPAPQKATAFTKADLERMVAELSAAIPQNAGLIYPIDSDVLQDDDVNAYANIEDNPKDPKKPQAIMRVKTGFLKFLDRACEKGYVVGLDPNDPKRTFRLKPGDQVRLLRAVVAHEMGHLSRGHVLSAMKPGDLKVIYTRETEREADAVGAAALQRTGHSVQDAQDMLLMLDAYSTEMGVGDSERLLGDHADCKRRAAAISSNPAVLRSLIEFDLGLAFAEARDNVAAMAAFDRAYAKEPRLKESTVNAALSAVVIYWDQLDPRIRGNWYRPDFGPLMKSPISQGRDGAIRDEDRKRYADAVAHAAVALRALPNDPRALEVAGLVQVLDPDGAPANLAAGIANLQKAAAMAMRPEDRLRLANNLAVGLQRSGQAVKGVETMVAAQRASTVANVTVGENLGRQAFPKSLAKDAATAADAMRNYLVLTPNFGGRYEEVQRAYASLCSGFGIKPQPVESKGSVGFLTVLSLSDGGQTLRLFDKYADVQRKLGAGDVTLGIKPSGEDRFQAGKAVGTFEARFRGGNVLGLFQAKSSDPDPDEIEMLRITSYSPGAALVMRLSDARVEREYPIAVGMAQSELDKIYPTSKLPSVQLLRVGSLEEWKYYPGLNFGVCLRDGKVAGITVTPVKLPKKSEG